MDITNLVMRYKLIEKNGRKKIKNKNPLIPMLIFLFLILICELVMAVLQTVNHSLKFNIICFVFYVLILLALIIVVWYKNKRTMSMLESYYEPNASYRIKLLCILLIEQNLDYQCKEDIDNLIYAAENQRKGRFRIEQLIPDWIWTAIIGPTIVSLLKIYFESKSIIFQDDIVNFIYFMFLLFMVVIMLMGIIVIINGDDYGRLKHDLIQLKLFNKYYSKYDEIYRKVVKAKCDVKTEQDELELLYHMLW